MNKIALSVEKLTKIYTKKEKDHDKFDQISSTWEP